MYFMHTLEPQLMGHAFYKLTLLTAAALRLSTAHRCVISYKRCAYEGTAVKDSNRQQGSERYTRFQRFITCAIHNQFLIFKQWDHS
jgi:hypothetical protein